MMNQTEFKSECWKISTVLFRQAWGRREPVHPGHAPDTPAERFLSAIRLGKRMLLMSRTSEATKYETSDEYLFEGCIFCNALELDRSMETLSYDGWSLSKLADFDSVADQSHRFHQLIAAFYRPNGWSLVGPEELVGVLSGKIASGCKYFVPEGDEFRVDPVAAGSARTGVTTGIDFRVYDENLCQILDVLRVPYHRGDAVCDCLSQTEVGRLVESGREDALNQYKAQSRAALAAELRATEQKLTALKERMPPPWRDFIYR
jgi:hypothetical protein